jgi:hypothetical protein
MKFSFKLFEEGPDTLLAIADSSLLGKNLEEGELCLFVSKDFYCEKFCDEKEAKKLLNDATIVNAVGRDIIELMIDEGLIKSDGVIKIFGVPHAQIVAL